MITIGSNTYDETFLNKNMMGPNAIKIINELTKSLNIDKNMKILDLGCGTGLTSIFLVKEFNANVFATDLWIDATSNYLRFQEMGVENNLIPIHSDANNLPFANSYFDLIISIDAYHYFGCNETYLSEKVLPLLKPDGIISIAVPGLKKEFNNVIPEDIKPFMKDDMNFHSCEWWKQLWSKEKNIEIIECKELNCLNEAWSDWLSCNNEHAIEDREMMKIEDGKYFNLVAITGKKKQYK